MEGESTRQQKIGKQLQKDLAEIIRSKGMAVFGGAMVTVSEVRVSPDLSFAKVFVSIFPSAKGDQAMEILQNSVKQIRGELGRLVGKQFRIVPEIAFYRDNTLDYVEHIDVTFADYRPKNVVHKLLQLRWYRLAMILLLLSAYRRVNWNKSYKYTENICSK